VVLHFLQQILQDGQHHFHQVTILGGMLEVPQHQVL
jgi:hypothetical protein